MVRVKSSTVTSAPTLSSPKISFLQALRLPPSLGDEACSRSISDLISLVITEQDHLISLEDIYEAVVQYDCAAYLEPLDILPALLPCHHDGAMDLLRVCALNNSPKEVMIMLQEAIEHLQLRLDSGDENDTDLVQCTIGIVLLSSPAISRSRLGRRSPLKLCSPVLENVASLILSVSPLAGKAAGRILVAEVARLVKSHSIWASEVADTDGLQNIKSLLRELLDSAVMGCAPVIQALLALRAAERYFPRFFVKSSTEGDWQGGEAAMREVQLALETLGQFPTTCSSFSDVVYLAHATPPVTLSPSTSSALHRLLVNALQMNTIIDEALFLLLRALTHANMSMSPEIIASLCTTLTALASTHLDPIIRQLNLRLLSVTLTKLPPAPRLDVLLDLATREDFPQIRGPAIGLVKEAVLEALSLPPNLASRNPFASPELLRIFSSVLFRPIPPDFFSEQKSREELAQSLELLRLVDCLSFYYVLLQRDGDNRTGVRSKGNIASIQNSILGQLRSFVDGHIGGEEPPLIAILSLQIGLDRIDGALRTLDLVSSEAVNLASSKQS